MPPKSVLVTYTLHPSPPPAQASYTARSPLITALEGIRAQLPLTNLHWKPTSRTSIRTIQSLDVNLAELGEVGTLGKEVAGSVLQWPLVNLCLVTCESDEMYKNQTRSFIRDWLSLLAARRNVHAPLIVLVNTPSTAAASGKNVFGRDKGVIAKLRTDFNNQKRDRCVQLNLPAEGKDDPATWVEVINKLKESIVFALDGAMLEREEDVKRGEAQRLTVGWNFCTWFLLKESLAHSFEGVNLYEDALVVYEELEASFIQVLKEQNLSWFGKLGATGARDDSLPVLDTTVKAYRDMLQSSSISIFDFRIYVFARQAQLLGKIGRITEIAKRGQWFVASLARRLRENEPDLAENFIESWSYTACMDLVSRCDEWSRIDRPNGDYSGLIAYESARSELLDIARVQVERIGVSVGHLPNEYPFAQASAPVLVNDDVLFESSDNGLSDEPEPPMASRPSLSSPQLVAAVADGNNFRALYATLTKRAMVAYEACHKANSVIRLQADLAALALLKEDWTSAYDLCRTLAKECAELLIWEPASKFALAGALRAHGHLALDKGEDWTNLALAYLRICAIVPKEEVDMEDQELEGVLRGLEEVPEGYTVDGHKAFSVGVKGDTASWGDEADVSVITAEVKNSFPITVQLKSLKLDFTDPANEEIIFEASDITLTPRVNTIALTCTTSVQGVFSLRESRLQVGNVIFAYSSEPTERQLRIHRNPSGPRTVLRMPHNISLDRDPTVVLEVHAGEVDLTDASVYLASSQDDVRYEIANASSDDAAIKCGPDGIAIGDIKAGKVVHLVVPYAGNAASELASARAVLRYTSASGQERTAISHQRVAMGLPLTVNVQDFFRPDALISHFTIASDGREHLRIESVKLDDGGGAGYSVESARKSWDATTVVTPAQPLSCLFRIQRRASDASAVLRLLIQYRGIEDEIRARCLRALEGDATASRAIQRALDEKGAWLQEYLTTGLVGNGLHEALRRGGGIEDLDGVISTINDLSHSEEDGVWRTLEIPVDVPQRRLLTSVRFDHTSPQDSIYEGRAISLQMTFDASFNWLGAGEQDALGGGGGGTGGDGQDGTDGKGSRNGDGKEKEVTMMWDVAVSQDDWVVLGRKKGQYTTGPQKATQEIVLVPVRAGKLFLPTVHVNHLPSTNPSSESRTNGTVSGQPGSAQIKQKAFAGAEGEGQGARGDDGAGAGNGGGSAGEIVCETFVVNAAEVVDVLPAGKMRTVLVPIPQRDGWDV